MIVPRYNPMWKYDDNLPRIINGVENIIKSGEDDFLILIVGDTGCGKSHLMLHIMEMYLGDMASVDYIGLNRQSFANALKRASTASLPRFLAHDEAAISKRDSLTKYNKHLIDLYMSIRGLKIFHVWCNPSANMIDKMFIEERLRGLIHITTKDINNPRVYYYYQKKGLLKIWNKYSNLKLDLLKKVKHEYSFSKGYFKRYEGRLLGDYLKMKDVRMAEKVEEFYLNYGKTQDMISFTELSNTLGIPKKTLNEYELEMSQNSVLSPDDIHRTPTQRKFFSKRCVELFTNHALEKSRNHPILRRSIKDEP